MSTQFTNRQWRLPNNENKDKQSNYSMDFGGTQYIDAGTGLGDSLGTYTGDASISLWFKANTTTSNDGLFSITPFNGSYFGSLRISLYNNGLYFSGNSTNGSAPVNYKYTSFSDTTNWHHVVCIFKSGDITNSKIYIDGVDQTTTDVGTFASSLSLTGFKTIIGAYRGTVNTFNGSIDAVSIFDYALTDGTGGTVNQIAALYGSSSTGIGNPMSLSPKPVFYAPLGDQDAFNGANYLVPNSSLKDFVFDFVPNDYIDCGSVSLNSNTGTFSAWIKTSYTSDFQIITGIDSQLQCRVLTTGEIRLILYHGGSFTVLNSTATVNNGNWHHVAFTYSSSGMSIYIDGSGISNSVNVTPLATATDNFLIGARSISGTLSKYFNGSISNAQIFNTTLPATGSNSVETLYNNGSPLTSMSGFTSLQNWWKLDASDTYDSSTGNWTIEDHAGSNDGTSSGMTQANLVQSDLSFTSGYSPYALDFDGTNDSIDCGINSSTDIGDLSVSFWFNKDSSASGYQYVFNSGSGSAKAGFVFAFDGTNIYIGRKTRTHTAGFTGYTNIGISADKWHHISLTYNDTSNNFTAYLDGQSVHTSTGATATNLASSEIIFGRISNSTSAYYKGKISNASIWNTELSPSQITEIYNEGVPSNLNNHSAYSNLVSWWQLGSNTSWVDPYWIALDEKGTNNGQSQNVAAPNNMGENAIVDGVGSYANGLSNGMGGDEVVGDAPYSTANSLSVNMDVEDRTTDTPS